MREQQHVADRWRICQQHDQPVYADANTRRWRKSILNGTNVIVVIRHRLVIARRRILDLRLEALDLIFGVIKLREAVSDFTTGD